MSRLIAAEDVTKIDRVARSLWIEFMRWNASAEWPTWGELLAQGHQGAKRVSEFRLYAQAAIAAIEKLP